MKVYFTWLTYLILCLSLVACDLTNNDNPDEADNPINLSSLEDTTIIVPEDTPTDAIIGALTHAADIDLGGADITIGGVTDPELIIDFSEEGDISLKPGFHFDFETQDLYIFTVTVELEGQNPVSVTLRIEVTDVQEGPLLTNNSGFSVYDNITSGTLIGNIIPIGVSANEFQNFRLTGAGADNFDASTNGDIKLASSSTLNADVQTNYSLALEATNTDNEVSTIKVTITVNKALTVPVLLAETVLEINENSVVDTEVGFITILDNGGSSINSISLTGLGAGHFNVDSQGRVTVSKLADLDFEIFSNYGLEAVATNASGDSLSVKLYIHILDVEVPPTLQNTVLSIQERAPKGSYVGRVIVEDAGESDITSFILSGDNYHFFTIDNNGIISVAFDDQISSVTRSHYSLTAYASNQQGDSNVVSVTINVEALVDNNPPKLLQHLVHNNPVQYDFAGNALALLDQQLYMGIAKSSYAPSNSPDYVYYDAGSVAIFNDIKQPPSSEYKIKLPDNSVRHFNNFGSAVSALNHASQGLLIGIGEEGFGTDNPSGYSDGEVWIYKKIADDIYNDFLRAILSETELAGAKGLGHSLALGDDYFISGVEGGIRGVFLFSYDALGKWDGTNGLISKLRPANLANDSNFGDRISLQGNYFAVTASNDSSVSGVELIENTGAVYLYKYDPNTRTVLLLQRIQASDALAGDFFGQDVSINDDYIAITNARSSAYIFALNSDDTVTELSKNTLIKQPVSIEFKDNLFITSETSATVSNYNYAGSVDIYALEEDSLVYKHNLTSNVPESNAFYGREIAFDGRYLAVSADGEDYDGIAATGAVYIYDVKPDNLPIIINYQQDILLKDNADYSNIYEFEANSPQGGPFTYVLSGLDADKFMMQDNRLYAVSGFDITNPEDANDDNSYDLIVTVTDSDGNSRSYVLQVSVWPHQVMYYQGLHNSELEDGNFKFYGRNLQAKNGRLLVQDGNDWQFNSYLYAPDGMGLLTNTDLLKYDQSSDSFAYNATLGKDYFVTNRSFISPVPDVGLRENTVKIYPILSDGDFGSPITLEQQDDENLQHMGTSNLMGNHLIVYLWPELINEVNVYVAPAFVIYSIDENGIVQRQHKYSDDARVPLAASQHFYITKEGFSLNQLNEINHQLEFVQNIPISNADQLINIYTDEQTGLDYLLTNENDSITLTAIKDDDGSLSLVTSIDYADYDTTADYDFYHTENLILAINDKKIRIFQFNLTDYSFRYLGGLEDSRFENISGVQKLGNYLYFADESANDNRGTIYIYKIDSDL